jgi:hypothetical protein
VFKWIATGNQTAYGGDAKFDTSLYKEILNRAIMKDTEWRNCSLCRAQIVFVLISVDDSASIYVYIRLYGHVRNRCLTILPRNPIVLASSRFPVEKKVAFGTELMSW